MAIYHCNVKFVSRSSGRSAVAAAAYRASEKLLDERQGIMHDYTRKAGVVYSEIIAPAKSPGWTVDRQQLWNKVESAEKRKDARLCMEVEVALPKELGSNQQIGLARGYAKENFVDKGMVADICLHEQNGKNPHAHIMLTTREVGADGFGKKNRDWDRMGIIPELREAWEEHANEALEKAGHESRIDHRTLEAQGIDRLPTKHLGPHVIAMEKRGIVTDKMLEYEAIQKANEALKALPIVQRKINEELPHNPDKLNELMVADRKSKDSLAQKKVQQAEQVAGKIEVKQELVSATVEQHEQELPERPRWYELKGYYKQAMVTWQNTKEKIGRWATERLDTLSKRMERIRPYLNYEYSLAKATEQIDKGNPERAKLYEEEAKRRKQLEKEQRKHEILEKLKLKKEQKQKQQDRGRGGVEIGD